MKVSKSKAPQPLPTPSRLSPSFSNMPAELLASLKTKYELFSQLKKEGLINQNRHLTMEQELKNAIQDLEALIPKLEVS